MPPVEVIGIDNLEAVGRVLILVYVSVFLRHSYKSAEPSDPIKLIPNLPSQLQISYTP